jgi:hypothetical protein
VETITFGLSPASAASARRKTSDIGRAAVCSQLAVGRLNVANKSLSEHSE